MSIEQKIAEILAESRATDLGEGVTMPGTETGAKAVDTNASAPEACNLCADDGKTKVEGDNEDNKRNNVDKQDLPEEFANMSFEEIQDFVMSEEFQQLDEISKKTLGSYVKKASSSLRDAERTMDDDDEWDRLSDKEQDKTVHRAFTRAKGINKAADKLAKEEIDYQVDIKEDVDALVNGEELSEEFKQKAATIFEAAVMNRVKQEVAKLDETYEVKLQEQVEEIKEGLVEKVDGYLDYVVEQWMEQNEIALESGMKSEILEGFVSGMKSLFEQHYIDIPEEKFDVLGSLEEQVSDLQTKLDEQFAANVDLNGQLAEFQAAQIVVEQSEGLVETDKEKFHALVEELEFDGVESFEKKVKTIRESYFTTKVSTPSTVSSVVTDSPVSLTEEKIIPAQMKGYLSILDNLK